MRFSIALVAAAMATSTAASPVAQTVDATKAVTVTWESSKTEDAAIQKRSILVTLLTAVGTAAASQAVTLAVNAAADLISDLSNWTDAREAFTKQTTNTMWDNNPDYDTYAAAICYNKGWSVQDSTKISDVTSAKLTSGLLNTDYDCMYMERGNVFYTLDEGGYINLSYTYNSYCTHDKETGDLTCV